MLFAGTVFQYESERGGHVNAVLSMLSVRVSPYICPQSPSMILHLPPGLKSRMAAELLPVLQAWYEEPQPLQMTSIYGVR